MMGDRINSKHLVLPYSIIAKTEPALCSPGPQDEEGLRVQQTAFSLSSGRLLNT